MKRRDVLIAVAVAGAVSSIVQYIILSRLGVSVR